MDALRRQKREPVLLEDGVIEQFGVVLESIPPDQLEEREQAFSACVQKLSEPRQQLLRLYFDGRPYLEISRIVGKSVNTLYATVSRLCGSLRDCVEQTVGTL